MSAVSVNVNVNVSSLVRYFVVCRVPIPVTVSLLTVLSVLVSLNFLSSLLMLIFCPPPSFFVWKFI